jgi:pyrroline-5-carboxylate reductase
MKVAVIGGGVMGQSIVDGWLRHGVFPAQSIFITDAHPEAIKKLQEKYPNSLVGSDNNAAVEASSLVLLCVKPFLVETVLSQLASRLAGKTLISIAAGIKLAVYHRILKYDPSISIIRAMPNIACRIDHGVTAVCSQNSAEGIKGPSEAAMLETEPLFTPLGGWLRVEDEKLMDVVTALNGSALAFGLMAIEAMADGAVKAGLPRPQSLSLSANALLAASSLCLEENASHPAVLREQITTPGGCTIAGLIALENGGFRSTLASAVLETTRASKELGCVKKEESSSGSCCECKCKARS